MRLLSGAMFAELLKEGIFPPPIHGVFTRTSSFPYGISHILEFFSSSSQPNHHRSRINHKENFWLLVKPNLHPLSKLWLWQPAVQKTFLVFSSKMLQNENISRIINALAFIKTESKKSSSSFMLIFPSIMTMCGFLPLSFVVLVFSI